MTRLMFRATLLLMLITLCLPASALPKYRIIDLCTDHEYWLSAGASDINNLGEICGSATCYNNYRKERFSRPVLWHDGEMIDIGSTSYDYYYDSWASAINDRGEIIGNAYSRNDGSSRWQAAELWNGVSGIYAGWYDDSSASDINERGQVAGAVGSRLWGWWYACAWLEGDWPDVMRPDYWEDPWPWPESDYARATSINDAGVVVGQVDNIKDYRSRQIAFVWHPGQDPIDLNLPALPPSIWGIGADINNLNQIVVSWPCGDGGYRALFWENGDWWYLPTLGGQYSHAGEIDDLGRILGTAQRADGTYTPCLWESGVPTDISSLVVNADEWASFGVSGMNSKNQFVGSGRRVTESDGRRHALLLKPIIPVRVDVRPGDYKHTIQPDSKDPLPAAILGSAEVDVRQIDPLTITLAGAHAVVKPDGKWRGGIRDVNNDRKLDLVFWVDPREMDITPGQTSVHLEAMTFISEWIEGEGPATVLRPWPKPRWR